MKVYTPRTRPSGQGLGYLQAATPNLQGATQSFERAGLTALAKFEGEAEKQRAEEEARLKKVQHFRTLQDYTAFETSVDNRLTELKKTAQPDDPEFENRVAAAYGEEKDKFIQRVPSDLAPEFEYRADLVGQRALGGAKDFKFKAQTEYFKKGVDDFANKAAVSLKAAPTKENMRLWKDRLNEMVEATDVPPVLKEEWKRFGDVELSKIMYGYDAENGNIARPNPEGKVIPGSQGDIIGKAAGELGIDPIDLATVISYETGGKFSTSVWGGKGGGYLGLIQFGAWERERYGVKPGQSFDEQMKAVTAFLKDRGIKPGMGILDLYSTINAGSPGRYNASDGPGQTVARHVVAMQQTHRGKAEAIVNGKLLLDGIDFDPDYANIPYEDRLALRRDADTKAAHADTELEKQAERDRQQRVTGLYAGIVSGEMGQTDIDAGVEEGWLSFGEQERAQNRLEKIEKEGADMRLVQGLLGNPNGVINPGDERHRAGLNALVGQEGLAALQNGDQAFMDNGIIPLVSRAQDVPTDVAGTLVGMSRSNDPAKQAFALDALARIQDASPDGFAQRFDPRTASDVELYQEGKVLAGLPVGDQPADGMKLLMAKIRGGITQEERQANELLRAEAKRLLTSRSDDNYVNFEEVYGNRFWGRDPELPAPPHTRAAMQRDFSAVFTEEWARGGDRDKVLERTLNRMDKVWGSTELGGSTYWMKHPPAKAGYPPINKSHSYVEDAIRTERGIQPDEQFQLISDDRTAWEIQQFQRGKLDYLPSYKVVKLNSVGAWEALEGRQTVSITPDMLKKEQDRYTIDNERTRLGEWIASVYAPAIEHAQAVGTPIPEDIITERKQREELVDEMQKLFDAGKPVTSRP